MAIEHRYGCFIGDPPVNIQFINHLLVRNQPYPTITLGVSLWFEKYGEVLSSNLRRFLNRWPNPGGMIHDGEWVVVRISGDGC